MSYALVGVLTGPRLVEAVRALHADPRWRPGLDTVWDGRALTELDLEPAAVAAVADLRFGPATTTAGRAVMVVRREVDMDAALLFQALARRKGKEAHVVRSVDEALAVLGLDGAAWDGLEWTPADV